MKYALALAGLLYVTAAAAQEAAQDAAQGATPGVAHDGAQPGAPDKSAGPVKKIKAASRATRPLPVVIPQQFAPAQEVYASMPESDAATAPAAPSECQKRLAPLATFKPLPLLVGPGECGATDAVLLDTIILADQGKVAVTPPATLRCTMAEEIVHWLRDDVSPAVKTFGAALRGLDNFDSYDCRGRDRIRAATLSEHGRANALDVRAFKLADGQAITLTDVNVPAEWREGIRAGACARFMTVLGPGSDGYHEEHIHLDLAERHNGYKVCEWAVREPPPPPEQAKAQDNTAQQTDTAHGEDAAAPADATTAPVRLDDVPLPRPRPLAANAAEIGAKTRHSD